ncbi:MAG TPA: hypothetical protein VGR28_02710 [Candidatus Thermoplasmatota archaeon]|jgi:hypothetical protein|nr:hypothetical protein [Candidatus Thermoplasmatota archaeon]
MKQFLAIAAFAAVLALPGALADEISTGSVTDPLSTLLPPEAGAMPVFYVTEDGSVWQESNGCAGLQTEAGSTDSCGDIGADGMVNGPFGVPALPEL